MRAAGRKAGMGVCVSVVLAVLVSFWLIRIVLAGDNLVSDASFFHYPTYLWNFSLMAKGEFPLWNPYQLCGIPTLATLQGGLLYPPHLLYLVLPTHVAIALLGLLHLALLAVSILILARRIGLGPIPAALAALLVSMQGAAPGQLTNPGMLESAAWLGVGFLAVAELAGGNRVRGVVLMALAVGMSLLAGFPQFSIYSAYAWAFVLLAMLGIDRTPPARAAGAMIGALLGVGLGVLLASAQLLPALELVQVGGRERGTLPLEMMYPTGMVGFATPLEGLKTSLRVRPSMPGTFLSFGAVGMVLAVLASFNRRLRGAAAPYLVLGILVLIIAMGPSTPLFDLYLLLPEVGSFRNPWRIVFVADFCFALVAAIGLDLLLRRSRSGQAEDDSSGRAATARPVALVAAASVTALAIALSGNFPATLFAGAVAAMTAVHCFGPHRLRAGAFASVVVVLLAAVEIFMAEPHHFELPYGLDRPLTRNFHEQGVISSLSAQRDRVWPWFYGDVGDISQKVAAVQGVRSIWDHEILTIRRQREYFSYLLWGRLEPKRMSKGGLRPNVFYGNVAMDEASVEMDAVFQRSRLVDLASARYLLVPRSKLTSPPVTRYVQRKRLRLLDNSDPRLVLFESPQALARVYWTHGVERAPEPMRLLAALSRPEFDPRELSYVETDAELPVVMPRARAGEGEQESATIVSDGIDDVVIEVDLRAPALLVLADTFYPGWVAEVDGEATPIYPTNHLFRGVSVPAGKHQVGFHYRPRSVRSGAIGSFAALLAIAALAAWSFSPRPVRELLRRESSPRASAGEP